MVIQSPPTAEAATETSKPSAAASKGFRISGAVIKDAIKDLPAAQQDAIWWFSQYCHRLGLSRSELGRTLKKPNGTDYYSSDSIIQLLGGGRIRRGENIEPLVESIAQFRRVEAAREEQVNSGFIETRLFQEISSRCTRALNRQRIMFIFGDSQIGKTASLREIQRRDEHGQTVYIEVPTSGSLSHFLQDLAASLNIPKKGTCASLVQAIIGTFDTRMLLIVDEAHRCLLARRNASGSPVLNFLRELYNKAGCGIVISMTNEGRDDLLKGTQAKAYEQIWRRRIAPLQLPNVTPEDDLERFARAYGLPPAPDEEITISVSLIDGRGRKRSVSHTENPLRLQNEVNAREGLGVWITILQDACDMAADQKRDVTWGAVIKAHAQSLAEAEILS